jgi:hypothetical protein
MRYMTLFTPQLTLRAIIDLKKASKEQLIDFLYIVEKFDERPYLSNYKDLLTATFRRIAASSDPLESRRIALTDAPARLTTTEAVQRLEEELSNRKPIRAEKRRMHPNSLANLRPVAPFEAGRCSYRRSSKVSSEALRSALERRNNGCSWRQVGDQLRLPASTVRSALRRAGLLAPNAAGGSGQ